MADTSYFRVLENLKTRGLTADGCAALSSGAEADARKAPGRDTQGDMELSGVGARAGGAASSQTEGLEDPSFLCGASPPPLSLQTQVGAISESPSR